MYYWTVMLHSCLLNLIHWYKLPKLMKLVTFNRNAYFRNLHYFDNGPKIVLEQTLRTSDLNFLSIWDYNQDNLGQDSCLIEEISTFLCSHCTTQINFLPLTVWNVCKRKNALIINGNKQRWQNMLSYKILKT